MKKFGIFFIFCLMSCAALWAQDYTVYFNNKALEESANKMVSVKYDEGRGLIKIEYKGTDDGKWNRNITLYDEQDNVISKKVFSPGINKIIFSIHSLKEDYGRKAISVYSLSTPKDPALAASVKVKRELLCKIDWQ
ncbi:MAG: hypothetical protein JWN76_3688 [Chitinophagaceae bacterium]|nr:hypothetical protein [Chitinophagaceae bacterium]